MAEIYRPEAKPKNPVQKRNIFAAIKNRIVRATDVEPDLVGEGADEWNGPYGSRCSEIEFEESDMLDSGRLSDPVRKKHQSPKNQ